MEFTIEEKVYLRDAINSQIKQLEHDIVDYGYLGPEIRKTWLNQLEVLKSVRNKVNLRVNGVRNEN
jgi:hypothetical protein